MLLVSPTYLDTCSTYAEYWCIGFNEKKTKVMIFGKAYKSFSCHPILLNDKPLEVVSQWKYLGITIKTDNHFSCSAEKCLASFYRSTNTILNVIKRPSEEVMMKLLYSVCVPILTYACDVKVFSSKEMTNLHVATNDAIRKIFTFHRWESVRGLREGLGYLSVTEIFAKRKQSFERQLPLLNNATLILL